MKEQIKIEQVLNVYVGKDGCRCGCKGRYSVTQASREEAEKDRGYAYDDADVSERRVALAIGRINKAIAAGSTDLDICEEYVDLTVNGRSVTAYFRK